MLISLSWTTAAEYFFSRKIFRRRGTIIIHPLQMNKSEWCQKSTHVAPTILRRRNCGVNWYLTNRPAFGSMSSSLSCGNESTTSVKLEGKVVVRWWFIEWGIIEDRKESVKNSTMVKRLKTLFTCRLSYFKQHCICLHVSNFETGEVDFIHVFFRFAEVAWQNMEWRSINLNIW